MPEIRRVITLWARNILELDNWIILDTETTGLNHFAEVIELSMIDKNGDVLLDTLIHPQGSIPSSATAIHGITEDMVRNAPIFPEILPRFVDIINQQLFVLIYNAEFDCAILNQTAIRYQVPFPSLTTHDLMKVYSHYEAPDYFSPVYTDPPYIKLMQACLYMGVPVGRTHRALDDARLTLALLKAIAKGRF